MIQLAPCFGIMRPESFGASREMINLEFIEKVLRLGIYSIGGTTAKAILKSLSCAVSPKMCDWFREKETFESSSIMM